MKFKRLLVNLERGTSESNMPIVGVYQGNPRASTLWKLRTVGPSTEVLYKGYDYGERADLSKGYWNLKRKM